MRRYVLDGTEINSLEQFAKQFSERVLVGCQWHGNLDALADILSGGFGTPGEGFVLVWEQSEASRIALGYGETVRQLEAKLERCHPLNRESVAVELELARKQQGSTVFEWLVEIIQEHGPGGGRSGDRVFLELR